MWNPIPFFLQVLSSNQFIDSTFMENDSSFPHLPTSPFCCCLVLIKSGYVDVSSFLVVFKHTHTHTQCMQACMLQFGVVCVRPRSHFKELIIDPPIRRKLN